MKSIILNIHNCQLILNDLSKAIKSPINYYKTKKDYLRYIERDVNLYKEQEKHLANMIIIFSNRCKENNEEVYFTEEYTIHDKINYLDTSEYL